MFKNQKHAFWQALLLTLAVFTLGILMGIILENWRTNSVDELYEKSELDLLDIRLQNDLYAGGNFNCDFAVQKNIDFANRIYEEAKLLDRYESASRLTDKIVLEHKKYDLLRTMLFINSLEIKEKCNSTYTNVVYFYSYEDERLDVKARQNVFSKLLIQLKERKGDEVLLIPIAGNLDSTSIQIILDRYDITQEDLPLILINEEIKITELENIDDLVKYFE